MSPVVALPGRNDGPGASLGVVGVRGVASTRGVVHGAAGDARPVVLVAHGSSDPRAALHTRALAWALGAEPSYLDHAGPRPGAVLSTLEQTGHRSAVLVPLLLTAAYHGRVDIPAVLADARRDGLTMDVVVSNVLGPVDGTVPVELLAGLRAQLPAAPCDAVVLGAAGTRDDIARASVEVVATRLGAALGVPCMPAYASASGPTAGEAVTALRGQGRQRVLMASYFLAPGRLYDSAVGSALAAGATAAAPPLGAALELVNLVRRRVAEAERAASAGTMCTCSGSTPVGVAA